jgi:hypothetical protein
MALAAAAIDDGRVAARSSAESASADQSPADGRDVEDGGAQHHAAPSWY